MGNNTWFAKNKTTICQATSRASTTYIVSGQPFTLIALQTIDEFANANSTTNGFYFILK